MSAYAEQGGSVDDEQLYGQHTGGLHPGDLSGRIQTPGPSRTRDVTWISTSRLTSMAPQPLSSQPPSAQPPSARPYPTANMLPPGFVPSEELDAEYMTVDPEQDLEGGLEGTDYQNARRKLGPRNFVGGFVEGLRKLPRVVLKTRDRKPIRRGTGDTQGTEDSLPVYHSPIVTAPTPTDVLYMDGPAMDMPVEHPGPSPSEAHSHLTDERSHHTNGPRVPSAHSHVTDGRLAPSIAQSHFTDGHHTHSAVHEPTYDTHTAVHSTTHDYAYDPRDGETTMVHHDGVPNPGPEDSPIFVEPRPSSDYDKMSSPIHSPSVTSLNSRFIRVGQFFQDLYDLPWVAPRITADYIPGEQSRAKYRKAPATWYPDAYHSPIDLLAEGASGYTPPSSTQSQSPRRHVPNSSATLAYYNNRENGPGASPPYDQYRSRSPPYERHRTRSPPYDGQYSYPNGYAPEYAAQPLYVYPSEPHRSQSRTRHGRHSNSTNQRHRQQQPEMQQARPVYIVAASPPQGFVPPPPPEHITAPPGAFYPYHMDRAPTIQQ